AQVIDVSGSSTPVSDLPCSPAMEGPNSGGQSPSLATCPACGGESHSQRERHDDPQLIIVADDRARLYELFQRAFAYDDTVHVLLDRRAAERRRRSGPSAPRPRRTSPTPPPTSRKSSRARRAVWTSTPSSGPSPPGTVCRSTSSRRSSKPSRSSTRAPSPARAPAG